MIIYTYDYQKESNGELFFPSILYKSRLSEDLRELCDWCDVIIFVFDISDYSSFSFVELMLTQVKKNLIQSSCFKSWFLIGNKTDLSERRAVPVPDANRLGYLFSSFSELSVKESAEDVRRFEGYYLTFY